MGNNVFGIDLGTSNIKIYDKASDSVMVQKNMIAIENKKNLFAYGDSRKLRHSSIKRMRAKLRHWEKEYPAGLVTREQILQ